MTIHAAPASTTLQNEAVAHELARLLADSYTLAIKTQGYHWNVIGPNFHSLHLLFETQYVELSTAIDVIAERIRALGSFAPGSSRAMARLASIEEEEGAPEASEMICRLIEAHETVIRTARAVLQAGEAAFDVTTVDLATERIAVHEKTLWMLRATAA
jgi:starvation-inducible DNA-binding protein